jgi:hypothetical protein
LRPCLPAGRPASLSLCDMLRLSILDASQAVGLLPRQEILRIS